MTATTSTSHAAAEAGRTQQLPLGRGWTAPRRGAAASRPVPCGGCRAKEARYGFREDGDEPPAERPRTHCFDCFRMEIARRRAVAARLARGWNATQVRLPLDETLDALARRRRRAQIAARHALGV